MKAASGWTSTWTPLPVRTGFVLVIALCAFWAVAAVWAMLNGPRLLAATEQQTATETELENQGVCQRLGMPSGSEGYATCASELKGVRQHYEDRLSRRSMGFI